MDTQDLLRKLAQIEEHAKEALSEFPALAKERLRMIRALARQLRSECATEKSSPPSEAALRTHTGEDEKARRG